MTNQSLTIELANSNQITLGGDLTRRQGNRLARLLPSLEYSTSGALIMDVEHVTALDTAGAWQIHQFIEQRRSQGQVVTLIGLQPKFRSLFKLIQENITKVEKPEEVKEAWLEMVGKESYKGYGQIFSYFSFIGELWFELLQWIKRPQLVRWSSIVYQLQADGYNALPIVAMLSFLIGIVLAYQLGVQLKLYGANVYVVDLLGMAVLREFSPLVTAVILAGRTGSAHTAQIGTMKLNEEIDALRTFGLSPNSLIVLPRIIGLTLSLPLLTVCSEVFSILGGMVMSNAMLGITFKDFLHRFSTEITLKTYVIGLIKTPVFAVLISSIGCFQGYRVTNSAESVGQQTTVSVVQGIFMIIVADAAFSILYTWAGL